MKTDLLTSIVVAIVGVLLAYFACDFIVQPIESAKIKTVDSSISSSVDEPSVDVFNNKSLNPTVEVYVGNCTEYNENGECLDGTIIDNNFESENQSETESINDTEEIVIEEQETR